MSAETAHTRPGQNEVSDGSLLIKSVITPFTFVKDPLSANFLTTGGLLDPRRGKSDEDTLGDRNGSSRRSDAQRHHWPCLRDTPLHQEWAEVMRLISKVLPPLYCSNHWMTFMMVLCGFLVATTQSRRRQQKPSSPWALVFPLKSHC